jgi:replicative DNA helicase Mcm
MAVYILMDESSIDDLINFVPLVNDTITNSLSDLSDLSNQTNLHNDKNPISISRCLRLHCGNVSVQGTITSISRLYKMIKSVTLECITCSQNAKVDYPIPQYYSAYKLNKKCVNCEEKITEEEIKIEYVNAISIELQDSDTFSDIEKLWCILFDENTLNIQIGSKVNISGTIQIIHQKNRKSIPCLYASSVHYENKDKLELSEQDIESIRRVKKLKGNTIIETLSKMFAPSVIGLDFIKKGLLLSAVSTSEDLNHNNSARDRINVLIIGNPGIGKSKIIKEGAKLVPNSRYESSQHASGKSLTAIVSKENEDYCLRLGPIPLAKGSLCILNEIGRISVEDQGFLLDVMEEGEFTINKYGINSKIKSPTVIIASANPAGSTWTNAKDDNNEKINMNEIPLLQPIKDRFDLKFILKDSSDEQEIRQYADEKSRLLTKKIPDYYQYLRKYIQYTKQINPILTEEARLILNEYYVNLTLSLKKSNPSLVSKRIHETLIRIAKSISKLKLKENIDVDDAKEALEFYNAVIYQYLDSTVLIPNDPKDIAIFEFTNILKNSVFAYSLEELATRACQNNKYVGAYLLGENKQDNNYNNKNSHNQLKIENNKKLRNIYNLLIENPNVKIVNEKPIALQWLRKEASTSLSDLSDSSDLENNNKNNLFENNIDDNDKDNWSDRSVGSDTPSIKITTKNSDGLRNKDAQYEIESKKESYECYYCNKFSSTTNESEYEKHVVLSHNNKPSYPSMADLEKNNLKPKGKSWEI